MTAVTQTDRLKSVRNRCVIKVFGGVFILSRCFLNFSVGVGVFVKGLSQISSFFSHNFVLRRILPESGLNGGTIPVSLLQHVVPRHSLEFLHRRCVRRIQLSTL